MPCRECGEKDVIIIGRKDNPGDIIICKECDSEMYNDLIDMGCNYG